MIERYVKATHTLVIDRTGRKPVVYRVPHGKPDMGPGIARKMANFAKASAKHVAAGRPKADQDTVDSRFAVCELCEFLNRDNMECLKCGCGIRSVLGPFSKLAWADSKCPAGKW